MSTQAMIPAENKLERASATPMHLLQIAMDQNADIDKLKALMELQVKWEDREAYKAYAADFVKMKPHLPRVIRTKDNLQTKSKYAPIEDINAAVNPVLQEYGFSTATKIVAQSETSVTVQAELWHKGGHVEATQITMPLDNAGIQGTVNKTGPHALSSSVTYGKRVALCALLNISTGDDVDGNGSNGGSAGMAADVLAERLDWIDDCRDVGELQRIFTEAYKIANAARDQRAMACLIRSKDARKKELQ